MSDFSAQYSEENLARVAELYAMNGFVLVEDVFTAQETEEMKLEMDKIVDSLDLERHPKSIFSTENQDKVGFLCFY
jgi:hypothetical protein